MPPQSAYYLAVLNVDRVVVFDIAYRVIAAVPGVISKHRSLGYLCYTPSAKTHDGELPWISFMVESDDVVAKIKSLPFVKKVEKL